MPRHSAISGLVSASHVLSSSFSKAFVLPMAIRSPLKRRWNCDALTRAGRPALPSLFGRTLLRLIS
jgi:hypothetical protein